MGLFDKKKKGHDDFDSPVEQIDLSAADPTGLAASAAHHDDDSGGDKATSASAEADSSPSRTSGSSGSSGRTRGRSRKAAGSSAYGIDDAIALMRTLPSENVELVVQVVKHTLESASIDIRVIIDDASDKQERLESRVAVLRDAIADLEREIAVRRKEIEELEADNKETTRVKERLMLAEKLTRAGKGGGDASKEPAAAATGAPASARQRRPTSEHVTARNKPPTSPPLPGIPASPAPSTGSGPTQGTFPPAMSSSSGSAGGAGSPLGGKPTTHTIVPKK